MTILTAGLKSNVYDAARAYLAAGVSIIPVKDKRPYLKGELWRQWMHHRPSLKTLDYWNKAGLFEYGVAAICGEVSNNLVVLDFDSLSPIDEFTAEFPRLHDTYSVTSGSKRGAHFYYYVTDLPKSIKTIFELRSSGAYVVAPPSIHSSGNQYEIAQDREPMRLQHMDDVVRWMKSKSERPAPEKKLPAPKSPTARPASLKGKWMPPEEFMEYRKQAYRQSAIDEQLAYLLAAPDKNRNNWLFAGARALGQLVGGGVLDRSLVEQELYQAALRIGLDASETVRTIKSGIDTGLISPRGFPF